MRLWRPDLREVNKKSLPVRIHAILSDAGWLRRRTPLLGQPERKISSKSTYWKTRGTRRPQLPKRENIVNLIRCSVVKRRMFSECARAVLEPGPDVWNRYLLWRDHFDCLSYLLIMFFLWDYTSYSKALSRESLGCYSCWKQFYERESTLGIAYRPFYGHFWAIATYLIINIQIVLPTSRPFFLIDSLSRQAIVVWDRRYCVDSLKEQWPRNQCIGKLSSGCLGKWMRKAIVDLIRCPVIKRRMPSFLVVVMHPLDQPLS